MKPRNVWAHELLLTGWLLTGFGAVLTVVGLWAFTYPSERYDQMAQRQEALRQQTAVRLGQYEEKLRYLQQEVHELQTQARHYRIRPFTKGERP